MNNILESIVSKTKKVELLNILNVFLASLLTLIGTVSIFSLLLYLNQIISVNYFICLILTIPLTQLYSLIANSLLHNIDKKVTNISLEIAKSEEEYKREIELKKNKNIQSIEIRFGRLSRKNKMQLLKYIEESLVSSGKQECLQKEKERNQSVLFDKLDEKEQFDKPCNYSRKRVIDKEIKKTQI